MLAYDVVRELFPPMAGLGRLRLIVAEGLAQLSSLILGELVINVQSVGLWIAEPRESVRRLLAAVGIQLPVTFRATPANVSTNRRLPT